MIRAHLLRWRPRQPAHVGRAEAEARRANPEILASASEPQSTPRVRPSGAASQLDPSHRSSVLLPQGALLAAIAMAVAYVGADPGSILRHLYADPDPLGRARRWTHGRRRDRSPRGAPAGPGGLAGGRAPRAHVADGRRARLARDAGRNRLGSGPAGRPSTGAYPSPAGGARGPASVESRGPPRGAPQLGCGANQGIARGGARRLGAGLGDRRSPGGRWARAHGVRRAVRCWLDAPHGSGPGGE